MSFIRKAAAAFGCLALAGSGVFLTAPAAQANAHDCMEFLRRQGQYLNGTRTNACYFAEWGDWQNCYNLLVYDGVPSWAARPACDRGAA